MMTRLAVVKGPVSDLERSIEEYVMAKRADGVRKSTIEGSYAPPLRRSLLPWCLDRGFNTPDALCQAVLNDWAVYLEDVGGVTGPLSKATIWTYRKAANQYLR